MSALRRGFLVFAAVLLAAAAPVRAAGGARAELTQIALEADAERAALTLSLSGPVAQRVFVLQRPDRVVIDLPGTRRRSKLPLPTTGSIVTQLRSGAREHQGLRLVVELKTPLQPRVLQDRSGDRYQVRIELGAAEPSAAAQPAMHDVRAAHAPSGARDVIVAVDPGHGGEDPGATGQGGTREKNVTLAIARALAARINREPGMRAVLTRDGDYFVALRARMDRARAAHADMFVSIHADAVRDRQVSGASVYTLSERGASSEAARTLAEQENAADLKGGVSLADQNPDLRSVLLDLSQTASIGSSVEAADRVIGALDGVGAVRKREVQQAAFVVLKSPDIPSMLIETAYISNPLEEIKLRTPAQQQRLAEAIFSGIGGYFRKYPPEGSLFARAHEAAAQTGLELARSGS